HIDEIAMRELLVDAMDRITEREQQVLALYYFEGLTLSQIGEIIGVTESRVSQIHSKAILTLRSHIERAGAA
ncbi:RNA polymerase sigma factor WhiG, partial [Enterococcus hirae]